MSESFCSLYREIHYIVTLLIVKGAGICSLFHEIHYIKIRYIKVWVILGWFGRQLSGQLMIFTLVQYSLIHDLALYITIDLYMIRGPDIDVTAVKGYLSNF